MKKIAFIDHSFHTKSRATQFLLEILKKKYEIETFWDKSWIGGPRIDITLIASKQFDVIILFQLIDSYSVNELDSLNCNNIILIPMFDNSGWQPDEYWLRFKKLKFINFSKSLHLKLIRLGIASQYFQFFLSPDKTKEQNREFSKLNGFFWQRTNIITWDQIKILVSATDFNKIHIHGAVDPPGYPLVLPCEQEKDKYNITISEWFSTKDDYLKLISDTHVFFAPRMFEGIGMAFIEAMAMGKCVVAPNNPTMNEYIVHGVNGLLYDPDNPEALDFSDVERLSDNSKRFMYKGYLRWVKSEKKLIKFIQSPRDSFWIRLNLLLKKGYIKSKIYFSVQYPNIFKAIKKILPT
ncbi:glycosyltransferase [Desulfococcaceae bacterium HSG9]|nr:glycosyltransferase [Desulfococcaceae bacterium HSG9]